jgi:hypothetical protein
MGIQWNTHGWDCDGCGEFGVTKADATVESMDGDWARLTKSAHDHQRACPLVWLQEMERREPLTESEPDLNHSHGDLGEYGEYNRETMGKDFPTPASNDGKFDHENEFARELREAMTPLDTDEEVEATQRAVIEGITQLLASDIERARKMWKDGPSEHYRLPPK